MEIEEIVILDGGLKDSPDYPACWCCGVMLVPFNSGWF